MRMQPRWTPEVAEEPQYRVAVVQVCRHGLQCIVNQDRERRTSKRTIVHNRDSDLELVVGRSYKSRCVVISRLGSWPDTTQDCSEPE
jgi:hypothetical protein